MQTINNNTFDVVNFCLLSLRPIIFFPTDWLNISTTMIPVEKNVSSVARLVNHVFTRRRKKKSVTHPEKSRCPVERRWTRHNYLAAKKQAVELNFPRSLRRDKGVRCSVDEKFTVNRVWNFPLATNSERESTSSAVAGSQAGGIKRRGGCRVHTHWCTPLAYKRAREREREGEANNGESPTD